MKEEVVHKGYKLVGHKKEEEASHLAFVEDFVHKQPEEPPLAPVEDEDRDEDEEEDDSQHISRFEQPYWVLFDPLTHKEKQVVEK